MDIGEIFGYTVVAIFIGVPFVIAVGGILWVEFAPSNAGWRREQRLERAGKEYCDDPMKFVGPNLPEKPVDWKKLGLAVWNGYAWSMKTQLEVGKMMTPSAKNAAKLGAAVTIIDVTTIL